MKIGIIGGGFVGKATSLLSCDEISAIIFDLNPERCSPLGTTLQDVANCDLVFIAVNTPMNEDGSCHTGIVESAIEDVRRLNADAKIVIRSTVPPGTSERLGVSFMPEFLTEHNWQQDFLENDTWIIGSYDQKVRELFQNLIWTAYENGDLQYAAVATTTPGEAEMCKYIKNCFLATKVSLFNEFYQYCKVKGIDYDRAKELACYDARVGEGHTRVPNYEFGSDVPVFGYGGHCFPKDVKALKADMILHNSPPVILSAIDGRNETLDRPEKEWEKDKGRATL